MGIYQRCDGIGFGFRVKGAGFGVQGFKVEGMGVYSITPYPKFMGARCRVWV